MKARVVRKDYKEIGLSTENVDLNWRSKTGKVYGTIRHRIQRGDVIGIESFDFDAASLDGFIDLLTQLRDEIKAEEVK